MVHFGTSLKWFESYQRGRIQSVDIVGVLSDPRTLFERLPQHSVLGPSLFAMYVVPLGDIFTAHDIDYMSYADDIQM